MVYFIRTQVAIDRDLATVSCHHESIMSARVAWLRHDTDQGPREVCRNISCVDNRLAANCLRIAWESAIANRITHAPSCLAILKTKLAIDAGEL